MGNCINKNSNYNSSFSSAGCLFTDGNYVLCGYQPNKKIPVVSGFGGRKHKGENYVDTAVRETVEELFEIHIQSEEMLRELKMIPFKLLYQSGSYINVIYSFSDLLLFLIIIKKHMGKSPMYSQFPLTIDKLMSERLLSQDSEISRLMLIPLLEHDPGTPFIAPEFVNDISVIKTLISPKSFILIN